MEQNKNTLLWVLLAVALLLLVGSFGMGGYGMMGFGTGNYGMMGFGMGFGFIFMLLFLGAAVWLIITFIDAVQPSKNEGDPLTILKRRFASGEISGKQYEEMKKEISG